LSTTIRTCGQDLSAQLQTITGDLTAGEKQHEQQTRAKMLAALQRYTASRYDLGKALAAYKDACRQKGTWVKAAKAIAEHIGRSPRTVFRIVADYDRVAGAPEPVLVAMQEQGFDPAEPKHATLLEQVTTMTPPNPTVEQVAAVVKRSAAHLKQSKAGDTMSEDERIVWSIRMDLRKRLNNVPDERKQELLERAIAEEAFEVWGVEKPLVLSITPKRSARTVFGRRRVAQGASA
jgi:hypothetical protein